MMFVCSVHPCVCVCVFQVYVGWWSRWWWRPWCLHWPPSLTVAPPSSPWTSGRSTDRGLQRESCSWSAGVWLTRGWSCDQWCVCVCVCTRWRMMMLLFVWAAGLWQWSWWWWVWCGSPSFSRPIADNYTFTSSQWPATSLHRLLLCSLWLCSGRGPMSKYVKTHTHTHSSAHKHLHKYIYSIYSYRFQSGFKAELIYFSIHFLCINYCPAS